MTDHLVFTRENQVGIITLNRPTALNALTLPMIVALQGQLLAWEQDDTIRVIVIRAAEGKAFCAGGDVRWLYEEGQRDVPQCMQFFWHEYRLNHFIHHMKKPYVSLLDGVTMGGGVGISLHGSHPIATERFVFAMPETTIGFFPDIGASHLLSRVPGSTGIYLGLTGNRLGAGEAKSLGLVRATVPSSAIASLLTDLLNTRFGEDAASEVDERVAQCAIHIEENTLSEHRGVIDAVFSSTQMERITEALRQAGLPWTIAINDLLLQKSPISLKVTLEQLLRAKMLNLSECVKMDYSVVGHIIHDHDFYEGVRALLVDKDKTPKWQPKALNEVAQGQIAEYFTPRYGELDLLLP